MSDAIILCDVTPSLVQLKHLLRPDTGQLASRLDHLCQMKLLQHDVHSGSSQVVTKEWRKNLDPVRSYQKFAASLFRRRGAASLTACAEALSKNLENNVGNEMDAAHYNSNNPSQVFQTLLQSCQDSMGVFSSQTRELHIWLDLHGGRLGLIRVEVKLVGALLPVVSARITRRILRLAVDLNMSRTLLLEAGLGYLCSMSAWKDEGVSLHEVRDVLAAQIRSGADHVLTIDCSEDEEEDDDEFAFKTKQD